MCTPETELRFSSLLCNNVKDGCTYQGFKCATLWIIPRTACTLPSGTSVSCMHALTHNHAPVLSFNSKTLWHPLPQTKLPYQTSGTCEYQVQLRGHAAAASCWFCSTKYLSSSTKVLISDLSRSNTALSNRLDCADTSPSISTSAKMLVSLLA